MAAALLGFYAESYLWRSDWLKRSVLEPGPPTAVRRTEHEPFMGLQGSHRTTESVVSVPR